MRLGQYLAVSNGVIRSALLRQSASDDPRQPRQRMGALLLDAGEISADELESAIRRQRAHRLGCCPLFRDLTQQELVALGGKFEEVSIAAGVRFIIEGDDDPQLYVLAAGTIEVFRDGPGGTKIPIAELREAGEPIGEIGYFQGGIRSASVAASSSVELLCAPYESLTHYFENVPHVAHNFLDVVEQRRADMSKKMAAANT